MKQLFLILIAAISASLMNAATTDSYKYIYEPGTIHIYENQYRYFSASFYDKHITDYSITMVLDVQAKGKGHEVTLVDLCSNDLYYMHGGPYKVYEEGGVLYEYYAPSKLQPLIDMRAHNGDQLYTYKNGKPQRNDAYTVISEDTIRIHGVERRRLQLKYWMDETFYWIDGIGSDHKFRSLVGYPYEDICGSFYWPYLVKCYRGNDCMMSHKDFYIKTSVEDIKMGDSDSADTPIYDLMGRQVTNPQSGHLYIQNGKKIIWQ